VMAERKPSCGLRNGLLTMVACRAAFGSARVSARAAGRASGLAAVLGCGFARRFQPCRPAVLARA
jgi:hypothetical protein